MPMRDHLTRQGQLLGDNARVIPLKGIWGIATVRRDRHCTRVGGTARVKLAPPGASPFIQTAAPQ